MNAPETPRSPATVSYTHPAYRRGSELLKHCQHQPSDAERQIQILDNGALRDFEPNGGPAR